MRKTILFLLIFILLLLPFTVSASSGDALKKGSTGTEVYAVQRRLADLGYLNYRPTGKFSDMTANAVLKFQQLNDITADGQIGSNTYQILFSEDAVRNDSNPAFSKISGRADTGVLSEKGTLSSWEEISGKFPAGNIATVIDYNTGSDFQMVRVGGQNCAHVAPVSESDFETYTYVFGGETWEHRSVLVEIDGTRYSASLFGMPTNKETAGGAGSGMKGYTILYFNNSKTDVSGLADEEHSLAITRIS